MSQVKRSIVVLAAVSVLLGTAVWVYAASNPRGSLSPAADESPGTLYLLQSAAGTLRSTRSGLRLVLRSPYAKVTMFEDRPARLGGQQALTRFVSGWRAAFRGVRPNAALQIDRAPAAHDIALLELGRPSYARGKKSLTFPVRRLRQTRNVHLRTFGRQADASVARSFGRSTLFIDSGQAVFGYAVDFNLFGPAGGSSNVTFTLALANTEFMSGPTLNVAIPFGQASTPVVSSDVGKDHVSLTFAPGLQLIGSMVIDLPPSSLLVQGILTLPPGYQVHFTSEAGSVNAFQSGPISIPAPQPPQ